MATENIVTGKKYRILKDATNKIWDVMSFWGKAKDVEFDDGKNAETKLGNIQGITSSLASDSSSIAASANAVKQLNDKITQLNSNLERKFCIGIVADSNSESYPKNKISWWEWNSGFPTEKFDFNSWEHSSTIRVEAKQDIPQCTILASYTLGGVSDAPFYYFNGTQTTKDVLNKITKLQAGNSIKATARVRSGGLGIVCIVILL